MRRFYSPVGNCGSIVAALLLALWAAAAPAQDTGPAGLPDIFDQRSAGGVLPVNSSGGYLFARHLAGDGVGFSDNYTTVGAFVPWAPAGPVFADRLVFAQPQVSITNDGEFVGNIGVGGRWLVDEWARYFGANLWYDVDSSHQETFQQVGLGLESRGEQLDFVSNIYVPLDGHKQTDALNLVGPRYVGRNIAFGAVHFFRSEVALAGVDMELGGPVPLLEDFFRAYGGWYHFQQDGVEKVWGAQGRVEVDLTRDMMAQLAIYDDDTFGTSVLGGVSWVFRGGRPERDSRARMWTLVDRRDRMAITEQVRGDFAAQTIFTDAATGQPIEIVHVDSSAPEGGDGSFERPYNDLQAAQTGSSPGDIILAHVDSVFDNPANNFITLQSGQRLLGEGPGVTHLVQTQEQGSVALPPTQTGGTHKPVLFHVAGRDGTPPSGALAPTAIRIGANNEVNNFTIDGADVALDRLPDSQNVLVENMTVRNVGLFGLDFGNLGGRSTNVTVANSSFEQVGFAMRLLNVTDPTIRNVDIDAFTGIDLGNSTGTITVENVSMSVEHAFAIADGSGTANITNLDIDTEFTGFLVSQYDGTVNVTGLTVTGGEIIAFGVGGRFGLPFASTVVNVDATSRIVQPSGRTAVSIGRHAGAINFAGTIDSLAREGMRFEDANGTYNFTGDIRLGSISSRVDRAAGVTVLDSTPTLLSFANLTVFSADHPGLLVRNASNVFVGSGAIDVLNATGIELNNADGFSLNNSTITTSPGFFTIDVRDSDGLSGSGNVAVPGLTCNDGGGNTGSISFGAQGSCP